MNNSNITQISAEKAAKLSLSALAIGSLPHCDANTASELVFELFPNSPMWAQLSRANRLEDMITQYLQGLPGLEFSEKKNKYFFNTESEKYYEELEEFFLDYEEIISEKNYEKLYKYAITAPFTSTFPTFLEYVAKNKPDFAKGHITGPLTMGTSICDENGKCAFYDDVLREILIKALTLKALWQIEEIKKVSPNTTPIIFLDEPAMSQYGTSALITIEKSDIICAIKEISEVIKAEGALSAVHCCGKTDWTMITDTGVNILNFDAFFFSKSLTVYASSIKKFIENGNFIAWGIVPTLDEKALRESDEESLSKRLEDAISELCKKGLEKDAVLERSIVTPSCGAGGLSEELATKAMKITAAISKKLKSKSLAAI